MASPPLSAGEIEKGPEVLVLPSITEIRNSSDISKFNNKASINYGSVEDLSLKAKKPDAFPETQSVVDEKQVVVELIPDPDDDNEEEFVAAEVVFPDGGKKAWLCVVGAFCTQFCSFGWVNTFGIFQEYYLRNQLYGYSPTTVSWISTLQSSIMFMGCLIVGRLFDSYGPRYLLIVGTVLEVGGIIITSFSRNYAEILIFQGIVAPMGAACVFNVAVGCTSSWFKQKRARALGIMSAGSSVGGIIYPFLIRKLAAETSFGWMMRACGFMILALLIVANFTITSNVAPRGRWMPLYPKDIYIQFQDINFTLIAISFSLGFVGFTLPFTYIVSNARYHDVDDGLATYLVSILNASSIFGRIIPAVLAERVGQYNMNSAGILLAGVSTLAIWIPARAAGVHVLYVIFYGFFSGTFVALVPACTAKISHIQDIGTRVGLIFACLSLANLAGVPLGGVILGDGTQLSRWSGMMAFAGAFLTLGGFVSWIARIKLVGFSLRAVC
ncbi:major facilitator superfamily domain-containing protein [Myxozyma melibiosi]|uniref:Major facilitator superfamily domain-containing protein n=1 Tax=Myxozyma melibiosi TaxID=54550 RepID=A0ABR1F6J5_9ASCO